MHTKVFLLPVLLLLLVIRNAATYSFYGDGRTYMNPYFGGFGLFGYGQALPWYNSGSNIGYLFPGWGYGNTYGYSMMGLGSPWSLFMMPHSYLYSMYGALPWYTHHSYPGHYGVYQMYGYGNNYMNSGYYNSGYANTNSANKQNYGNSYYSGYNNGYKSGPIYVPVPHPVPVPVPHRPPGILSQLGLGSGSGLSSVLVPALLIAAIAKG